VTERTSLALTVPFQHGTHSRLYADRQRHEVQAGGLGDMTLVGTSWLLDPVRHRRGNVAVALGVKAPTGSNTVEDDWFAADGSVSQRPVDQAIQPGDGGWAIIVQSQAYRQLFARATGYVFGSYMLSPKATTGVTQDVRGIELPLSVPDIYSARAGLAYDASPSRGVSLSLGARVDGMPIRDVIGGADDGFRRPGYVLYVDPGVTLRTGKHEITVSVPVRAHQWFGRSLVAGRRGLRGGGDLADYLIFASYSVRFPPARAGSAVPPLGRRGGGGATRAAMNR
jgi:hypothetical protein